MTPRRRITQYLGLIGLALQLWPLLSLGQKAATLCSNINTAGSSANLSIYQSQGLCGDFCRGAHAFAILNFQSCWCSDYAPSQKTIVDDDECGTKCPGYEEMCGGKGVFGYLALGKSPSGTVDSTNPLSTADPTDGDSPTQVQTVTADGTVRTVTIGPTAGASNPSGVSSSKKGLGTGAIVGIVVGIALIIIIATALAFYVKMRRRRDQQGEADGSLGGRSKRGSSADVMGVSHTPEMGESGRFGGSEGKSTYDPAAAAEAGNRRSRLMPVDPRMDPFTVGIYARNVSHESITTLHDDQDYSRRVHQPKVLRAVNPDPADD